MAGKYTAGQFIKAIKGSGGVISAIADAVGCKWHTAKRYINDYPTVNLAWVEEKQRITDRARHNIIKAISDGDNPMSKWWLQVMDDEFVPRSKNELTGKDGGPMVTTIEYVNDWRHPDADSST